MASPMLMSNPVPNLERSRETRKKNKKSQIINKSRDEQKKEMQNKIRWKTEAEQQIYSSKLIEALGQVRLGPPEAPKHVRAVREAADRALAVTAKGRTRWSRAILTNRMKLKFMKHKRQRVVGMMMTRTDKRKKPRVSIVRLKGKLPAVQQKVSFLGRLVPGCRKQGLPVILEETSDYIAALQMQIRAMTTLTELLSGSGSGGFTRDRH